MEKIKHEINHDLTKAKARLKMLEDDKNRLLGEIKGYENSLLIIEDYENENFKEE